MENLSWRCGKCGNEEGTMNNIQPVHISSLHFQYWKFRKLLNMPVQNIEDLSNDTSTAQGKLMVTVRCHHCGKPLCQRHRILIVDDVFAFNLDKAAEELLPKWWPNDDRLKASKRFRFLEGIILSILVRYSPRSKKIRQKAYHCFDCWGKYHPFILP